MYPTLQALEPLGEGIAHSAYLVPDTHPSKPWLRQQLGQATDHVVKFTHTRSPAAPEDKSIVRTNVTKWLTKHDYVPQHIPLSYYQQFQFLPGLTSEAWKALYDRMGAEGAMPSIPSPDVQGKPAWAMERVTPVQEIRAHFEYDYEVDMWVSEIVPKLKRLFYNIQWRLYKAWGVVLNDNHARNWGLRVNNTWKSAQRWDELIRGGRPPLVVLDYDHTTVVDPDRMARYVRKYVKAYQRKYKHKYGAREEERAKKGAFVAYLEWDTSHLPWDKLLHR